MSRFERDFASEFSDMAEVAKPISAEDLRTLSESELRTLSEHQRGERDCLNGVPHKEQSQAYNNGYAEQYAKEQEHDC